MGKEKARSGIYSVYIANEFLVNRERNFTHRHFFCGFGNLVFENRFLRILRNFGKRCKISRWDFKLREFKFIFNRRDVTADCEH